MKKIINLLLIISLFLLIPTVKAEDKNLVNIYLFHSDTCPHCREEIKLLEELDEVYDNVKIYKYEISDKENSKLFAKVSNIYNIEVTSVPFTIIGNKTFSGFSTENSKKTFIGAIEYYSNYGYIDKIASLKGYDMPIYKIDENAPNIDEYLKDYGNYAFTFPIIGEVNTKNLTLPLIAILMGTIDGFNPCAMWILLFLITSLISIKDKKRMLIFGSTFILTSGLVYFLIMIAWLNVALVITKIDIIKLILGILAIILGLINIISGFKKKEAGCEVTNNNSRIKIMTKIKNFTKEKSLLLAIFGVITLAISVNMIELTCSLGLPVMFSQILAINNVSFIEQILYILLYILFFLIDDIIIFVIAITSFKVSAISTKYSKLSKIIGGIILFIIGLFMILKPEWLMLNF